LSGALHPANLDKLTMPLKHADERVFVDESGDNGSMVCPL
jgi:hypothetical protein